MTLLVCMKIEGSFDERLLDAMEKHPIIQRILSHSQERDGISFYCKLEKKMGSPSLPSFHSYTEMRARMVLRSESYKFSSDQAESSPYVIR